jgi:hypothetical protein
MQPPSGAVRSRTEQLADKAYEMVSTRVLFLVLSCTIMYFFRPSKSPYTVLYRTVLYSLYCILLFCIVL